MTLRNYKEDKTIDLVFILRIFSVEYKIFKLGHNIFLIEAVQATAVF